MLGYAGKRFASFITPALPEQKRIHTLITSAIIASGTTIFLATLERFIGEW